ncbi:unnamed protein product [Protopolystoma xenopodis]|uniref:Uncharacterized protein n=1 Tax=Protopolystoma xenopodis TaxID=117903 RepID=A0A448WMC5_9PLAT|nr:unnamed protein product [Protopolystoma xenopodis]
MTPQSKRKSHLMVTRLDVSLCPDYSFEILSPPNTARKKHLKRMTEFLENLPVKKIKIDPPDTHDLENFPTEALTPTRTLPKPFSFHHREIALLEAKKRRGEGVDRQILAMANSFHAQPMPKVSKVSLPSKKIHIPVVPKPFKFETDQRIIQLSKRRELADKQGLSPSSTCSSSSNQFQFALKIRSLQSSSRKKLTVPRAFNLKTASRALERAKFDANSSTFAEKKRTLAKNGRFGNENKQP